MIWNFDYTIPSLIVLIFFLILYFLRPVLITQSNRIFLSFVVVEVIGFAVTFFSSYADNKSLFATPVSFFLCNNIYYINYIARYFFISLYFASLFNIRIKKDIPTIITIISCVTLFILIIINPWNELIYEITPAGKFHQGKYNFLIYYCNTITLCLDLYYILRNRKKLEKKEFVCCLFAVLALFACCFMDWIYLDYLITDMFFLFVMLILFFAFENPDNYVDKKTNLFNFFAFSYLVQERLCMKKNYSIITFIIKNYTEKKQIYGVKQMDLALKEIGKFFLSSFPHKKCFYLLNGKFAIIDNNINNFPKFIDIIEKRFKKPWKINNSELHLNIFIVDVDNDIYFSSLEDIYAGYGVAYDEFKKTPLTRVTINNNSYGEIIRKTKITKALNKALLEDDLHVYMQPIVDSSTRKIIGAEALVRIYDEDLGIIPPVEFITLAEKNGSIEQLGEQVLNKVCVFIRETRINDYGIEWINVNLSPVQCQNLNLSKKIINITDTNTVDHKFIHLEITEDSMIDDQILKNQMNFLITDGYKFSLDDFGSGFSNIVRVKHFPFNNIKLDMSLIQDHFSSPDNMLPSIVKTFTERGVTVTAEGVETKEMADSLEKMGCKYLQGYYFSKPIPSQKFLEIVKEQNNKTDM